ncbi:MAG: PEP-CTERM sorting domain-containing protein, partial [Alphaproteobacteria bacterium]|nr:PEP-CTERM sorting domain-containing protein [Alphaproteobacteria bacterium]
DGEEKSFSIFYGAANSETAANTLLGLVGIELFSFGQSDGNGATGTPGTYVFGFKGVGGVVIVPVPVDPVPVPATALLFGAGLLGLAGLRRKAA